MFEKMKLKPYLLAVFSVLIILTALLTTLNILGLISTKDNFEQFVDKTLQADGAIKTCKIEVNAAARSLREMLITDNTADYPAFTQRIDQSIETINRQIAIFKQAHGTEDGLAQKYEDTYNAWLNIADRATAQIKQGNFDEAKEILLNECSPALNSLDEIAEEIDVKTTEQKVSAENYNRTAVTILTALSLGLFALALILSLIFALRTTANITRTTNKIKDSVIELSKGNLKTQIDYQANNEFGELSERVNFSIQELAKYVQAIDYGMSEFAAGNFTIDCPVVFLGDFADIERSITKFKDKMNDVLNEINLATVQVNSGAEQVSSGAQSLAQGAAEQAGSVEELSATLSQISTHISDNAENSTAADHLGQETGELLSYGIKELQLLLGAIEDISKSSEKINQIISIIDDIAFQTNILALNAAVEAARAGQAGKGFAVVASEVRSLAQKSAGAVKETTVLIENSLEAVKRGSELASTTNSAFETVAEKSEQVITIIEKIAKASQEQAQSVVQITQGIDQISSVVQTNSATSEESAAASEELSGQANVLNRLMSQFQVKQ